MNKAIRQVLLFVSIAFFLGLAPLLVFYAMGYRLTPISDPPLPVGVVLVDSNPRRAEITVNQKPQGTTPQSIPNLNPGVIDITVSKTGYLPWQKNITINPATVSELRDIILFPANPIRETIIQDIKRFSLAPNRSLIAALTSADRLHILDDEGASILSTFTLRPNIEQLLWSPDSNFLLVISKLGVQAINVGQLNPRPISLPSLANTSNITWDQRVPGRLLYLDNQKQLVAYHFPTNNRQVLAGDINLFAVSSRYIYTITDPRYIEVRNLQGVKLNQLAIDTLADITKLYVTPGDQIALLLSDQSLFIIDKSELVPVAPNALGLGWSPDEKLIYVQTDDRSLYVFNAGDERVDYLPLRELKLITRLSSPIRDPQWFAGGRHLIYQTNDEIIISEIDPRDRPLTYSVDTTNLGSSSITVGGGGSILLYLKQQSNSIDLVSTELIIPQENFLGF